MLNAPIASIRSLKLVYGAESVISLNRDRDAKPDLVGETPITVKLAKNHHGTLGKQIYLHFQRRLAAVQLSVITNGLTGRVGGKLRDSELHDDAIGKLRHVYTHNTHNTQRQNAFKSPPAHFRAEPLRPSALKRALSSVVRAGIGLVNMVVGQQGQGDSCCGPDVWQLPASMPLRLAL